MAPKQPQKTQGKPPAPVKTAGQHKNDSTSIASRPFDLFFVFGYLAFFAAVVVVVLMTRCEHILPEKVGSIFVAGPVCRAMDSVEHLFGHALDAYKAWGEKIFAVKEEDFSLTLAHSVNIFFTAPAALLLAYAFFTGRSWAKNFALVHAAIMLYNMVVVDVVAKKAIASLKIGEVAGWSPCTIACLVYGFWTFFPVAVIARLCGDQPFPSQQQKGGCCCGCLCSFLWKSLCIVWGFAALLAFYEFGVKNVHTWKSFPSVADHSAVVWEQTAPHREALLEKTKDARAAAAEAAYSAGEYIANGAQTVGATVVDYAKKLNKGAE
jgi:hypothetical protein